MPYRVEVTLVERLNITLDDAQAEKLARACHEHLDDEYAQIARHGGRNHSGARYTTELPWE